MSQEFSCSLFPLENMCNTVLHHRNCTNVSWMKESPIQIQQYKQYRHLKHLNLSSLFMYNSLISNKIRFTSLSLNFPNLEVDIVEILPFTIKNIRSCIVVYRAPWMGILCTDIILYHIVRTKTWFSVLKKSGNYDKLH